MEELYLIIGKLYVDVLHAQKYIEALQTNLKDKDTTIADLKLQLKNSDVRS